MNGLQPRTKWQRFCAAELPFEIAVALGTLGTGILTGVRFYSIKEMGLAITSWTLAAGVFTAMLSRAVTRNRKAQGEGDRHALEGALHVIHAMVSNSRAENTSADIRVCVFVPGARPDTVHQITDYAGPTPAHGRGRDISTRCGVVGKAIRRGEAQFDKLPANTQVIDYLVQEFGYTRIEAAEKKQDRKAWAAIPIGDPGAVIAVLFIDSNYAGCFGNACSVCRKGLESAILGVAQFISQP